MKTIDLAVRSRQYTGKQIKLPWESVNQLVTLSTHELAMLAGAPGSGKSTVAISIALHADVPVLYCTQDSPASVHTRMAALHLNMPIATVRDWMNENPKGLANKLADLRTETLVVNSGRLEAGDIDRRIVAMTEWLGEPPALVIVDNLIDMVVLDGKKTMHHQDTGFYAIVLTALKEIANKRGVAIVALHHVLKGGEKGDGTHPITMTDMLHGGEREARHVWGVFHNEESSKMYFQVLKQQDGIAKPGGQLRVPLAWVPETGALMNIGRQIHA